MNGSYLRSIYLRLAGVVTLVVMLALLANAYVSHRIFEHALAPQIASKVSSVGASIRALVYKAVENGMAFDELYGVTERFAEIKREAPEISYIGIANRSGKVLYRSIEEPAALAAHFRSPAVLDLSFNRIAVPPTSCPCPSPAPRARWACCTWGSTSASSTTS